MSKCKKKTLIFSLCSFFLATLLLVSPVFAQPAIPIPNLNLELGTATEPEQVVGSLQLLLLLTVLTLVPAILALMTSFTRTVIVLSFVRNALGTQQIPPNQVLIGLALFLTFFIMAPVYQEVNTTAIQPYLADEIDFNQALTTAMLPMREFMFRHTREKDLALFINIANEERPRSRDDVALHVLIPAFVISELKTAFQMGFMIFIPFLVIDMVVASALMSMGMFMLPPVMVSLPFKLLLFVMVDGWHLVVQSLVESFV
ncbi:MAG: flagellar type III secretion system pore protein FliP [Clostridium sp.]|nr:flagellar type III secretion system pore protein FliP [Clostridium sp.]